MSNQISNTDDTIDSRDVIARIEELEAERETLQGVYDEAVSEHNESTDDAEEEDLKAKRERAYDAIQGFDSSEEGQELIALKALAEQGEKSTDDWDYGAQLINEDYFEEAMDELLEDIGDIPKDLPSYLTITVDYDALRQDYTEIDFDGQPFLVR